MIQNVKKILAPIDFSPHSMEAMRGAMELAKDIGAEVHLMHVIAPHHHFIPLPLATSAEQSRELVREAAMIEQAEEELARIKKDDFADSNKVFTFAVVGRAGAQTVRLCQGTRDRSDSLVDARAERRRHSR